MYILGIHDGHNCGATVSHDGRIVASISEERLTRRKNEVGYPRFSIEECLRIAGIPSERLDRVVYASLFMHDSDHLTDLERWYCVGIEEQREAALRPKTYQKIVFEERRRHRITIASEHLCMAPDRIEFIEHHLAHLAAAYYSAPRRLGSKRVLGLTCDGAGDNLCATVSVCEGNSISRIAQTDRHASLGKIYSRITMLMGMRPWEHEYKLMGMAPYADREYADRAADALRNLLELDEDSLTFKLAGELSTNYCYKYLRSAFERVRFDTIAGATQIFTEEMLVRWARSAVRKTGITDLVLGGGVFMNVKANMMIADLPEVTSVYVMPSGGDESLSIGACLHTFYQTTGRTDHAESVFENLYFGGSYMAADETAALQDASAKGDVEILAPQDIELATANLLFDGRIVARCSGRMEWGRAHLEIGASLHPRMITGSLKNSTPALRCVISGCLSHLRYVRSRRRGIISIRRICDPNS